MQRYLLPETLKGPLAKHIVSPGSVMPGNRVGGKVTLPVTPHHRTYGSVYGGS